MAAPVASALKQEKLQVAARPPATPSRCACRPATSTGGQRLPRAALDDGADLRLQIEDDKPGAVGNATRAMDDLIWSVKPKATQEQRKA
jgi:hypothetical protein